MRYSESKIQALTRLHFDRQATRIEECFNGMYNSVYFLSLEDDREIVLKVSPPKEIPCMTSEENMLLAEIRALEKVNAVGGFPVPTLLAHDGSSHPEYYFMTKLRGRRFSEIWEAMPEAEAGSIRHQIGQTAARLHTIEGDRFGFEGNPSLRGDSWKELMLKLFDAQFEDGRRVGFHLKFIPLDALHALIRKHADVFDDVKKPVLTHGDLWDGNVLVENGTVSGVIDFERACWADGLMENGFANYGEPDADFLRGYGKEVFTESERIRCILYRLSLYLGMSVGHCYRNGGQNTQPFWMLETFEREVLKLKNA